ncbi:hypothetical protein GYH36_11740 [Cellulosimicrobium cellulans]|uniref:Uncharacterized protein n=1 Tax=Cellulosimicrobium composti TaxID=2672572 RepID=A0ABX0BDD7_9MICO|nr:hypothetical protein [Cellulosimicrobium composti]
MQANRRRDTAPELALRRAAHARGLRYRVDARPIRDLNRRADMNRPGSDGGSGHLVPIRASWPCCLA